MRAIRCQRGGFPPQTLLTSMLAPNASGSESGALYHERWELEHGRRDEVRLERGHPRKLEMSNARSRGRSPSDRHWP